MFADWRVKTASAYGRLAGWCRTREGRGFALLLSLALAIRLIPAPFVGFFGDLQGFVDAGRPLGSHFWDYYSFTNGLNPPPAYPPLSNYLFGVMDAVYWAIAHLLGQRPDYVAAQSPVLVVVMKLPTIAADLATVTVIYAVARSVMRPRWALVVAAAYAFSPTVWLDGAVWGQVDALYTLAVVLAFVATGQQRAFLAGLFFAVSIMLKAQPAVLAPLIPLYLWRWAGWQQAARAIGGMAIGSLVICAPYLLPPHPQMLAYLSHVDWVVRTWPYATVTAYNLWWFLGDPNHVSATPFLGPLSADVIGWALFAVVAAVVAVGMWVDRSAARLYLSAALLTTAFFVLTTLQRERYIYPALALYLLASIYDHRNVLFFGLVSVTSFFNLAIAVLINTSLASIGLDVRGAVAYLSQHLMYVRAIASAYVMLLVSVVAIYAETMRRRPAAADEPVVSRSRCLPPTRPSGISQ